MSVDPAAGSADSMTPQTWNRYAYANNNPIILVDPDGESATLIGALAGGVAGGAAALLRGEGWRGVAAGAAGGAVAGGMMGSVIDTGGASLGVMVAAGGLSSAAGGMVQRLVGGQSNSATAVAADAAGGAAGVMVGAAVGAVAQSSAAQTTTFSKSAAEMADDLSAQTGKGSVSFETVSTKGRIDLTGKSHFDKATGQRIPTLHVQTQTKHVGPNGKVNTSGGSTRPATKQDIRTARKLLEQQ